jgi:hypothetical protein
VDRIVTVGRAVPATYTAPVDRQRRRNTSAKGRTRIAAAARGSAAVGLSAAARKAKSER